MVSEVPEPDLPGPTTRNILVVEDNEPLLALACVVLEELGYGVTASATVEVAIDHLQAGAFDLVVADVVFHGGQSGIDLLVWLRSNAPEAAVLLTSGLPLPDDEVAQGVAFLQKPYRIVEFAEAVADAIDRKFAKTS